MVFVLDNYDSFTYNLVQYLGELGADVEVRRNDELTAAGLVAKSADEQSQSAAQVANAGVKSAVSSRLNVAGTQLGSRRNQMAAHSLSWA